MKAAKPIADFDTWFRAVQSTVKLAAHPGDLIAYWGIILSFAGITLHTMMMLIEYHLAVMLASVLIPWGIWRLTAGIAEFSLGWLTGSLIAPWSPVPWWALPRRSSLCSISPCPAPGFYPAADVRAPGRPVHLPRPVLDGSLPASRLAGQASSGLTGSTLTSAAMGMAASA